jgi:serine/threonine-protein kinase HipA
MNRRGNVYYDETFAGVIEEDEHGFSFTYDHTYVSRGGARPVSLTLPIRTESFRDKTMLAFFDGLIPEGWLLDIAERSWKLSSRDRMGLLLA